MTYLPHTNTVILLEPYCGTITEPGLPVVRVSAVCKIKPSACSWTLPEAPFDCKVRYKGC